MRVAHADYVQAPHTAATSRLLRVLYRGGHIFHSTTTKIHHWAAEHRHIVRGAFQLATRGLALRIDWRMQIALLCKNKAFATFQQILRTPQKPEI